VPNAVPNISVVVPAFDAAATIERCIQALRRQSMPTEAYEIIVVDDGSADDTATRAIHAGARVVRLPSNVGPGGARNTGVAVARGETIVFTDADCEPTPEFLAELTAPLRDPQVGGAKGVYLSKQRSLVARFVQLEYEHRDQHAARQPWLDVVATYACCFRRRDLMRIGGFDPRLRVCEDQELSFRLAASGVRTALVPGARTYHTHCDGIWRYVRKKFRIARWKAHVVHRHPRMALRDSHTPQTLKAEIIASNALWITALYCLADRRRNAWLTLACALAGYAALAMPFTAASLRRDPVVGLMAPALLLARDLALGAGLICGVLEALSNRNVSQG
jgi:glycosyltransferase involved in cell wall biosynthesis